MSFSYKMLRLLKVTDGQNSEIKEALMLLIRSSSPISVFFFFFYYLYYLE